MPRKQFQQAHRYREEFEDGSPDLVTCGVYFIGMLLIGAVIGFLVLKLTGSL